MKVKKLNYQIYLKYLALFFVCLIFANGEISHLSPMMFAFFFACLYVGINEKVLSFFVLLSSVIINFTLENFFVTITVVAVGLITFYLHRFLKRRIKLITLFSSYIISLATYIYYNFFNLRDLILYLILGLICLFVFIEVLQAFCLKKNCFQLTLDESICCLFAIALIGVGLNGISIFEIEIYRFVLMLIILICVSIGNPTLTYAITLSFSFGVAISAFTLLPVAEFVILALLSSVFRLPNRFKIVFMVLLSDLFLQYFFFLKSWEIIFDLIPILFACVVFLCLPTKMLNTLEDFIYVKKSEMSSRNLINITRKNIRKRMSELSNVFFEMKQLHINMIKKELTKDELVAMLSREVMSCCCKDCLDKNKCTRSLIAGKKSNIDVLIEIAINKGKVSLLDLPSGITNRCLKVNNLIGIINRLSDEYRQYKTMVADVNNVKILLADQMGAVSNLLLKLGDEVDTNVKFDIARENKIISRLLGMNIQCKEVLLYNEKNEDISAVLVVKTENAYDVNLEKVVSETMKCNMQIEKVTPVEDSGFNTVMLKKKGKYDCVFGLASCSKSGNEQNGDCHSIIRLGGNKFLLALCDGMGSGIKAHQMSAMTLGLIENFYKAGFDNDIILESVNKLLAINNQENYSTLDICLLDLEKEIADFIKVGAPFGLIKRDSAVDIVEGGALPIGALDSIKPSTFQTVVTTKDIIIMTTDGITDAFKGQEELVDFVSTLASNNPQVLAETILNEALNLNKMSAKDDMTVLVARTYLKN